ncbi:MAG TPA: hypothetical protein VFH63_02025, partial [candidate division Zixibacteria bacterium]|nr:hypothetical protein [candidate division Zixibacteria bacterium]
ELLAVEPLADPAPVAAPQPAAAKPAAPQPAATVSVQPTRPAPEPAPRPEPEPVAATQAPEAPSVQPTAAASGARPNGDEVRARWGEVVQAASPALKPILADCRPVTVNGARVTLAFPEERAFMREKARNRAAAIEQLLARVLGGTWAIECVASNVELEPLSVQQAVAPNPDDPDAQALLEGVLRITGGELVDVPEVR